MRITDMNWMQVEEYLRHDDRAVLPLGSTEQHSHLRLTVDCILPERVAAEAAEPLGVPVFPVVPYGVTPYFREFPGSISLRVETHLRVVRRHPRRHGAQRVSPHPDRQRPRRQQRRAAVRARVGRRSPRLPRALPQLVERAAHVGQGAGDRSGGVARLVDGELPVDAPARRRACPRRSGRWSTWRACARSIPSRCAQYLGDGNFGGHVPALRRRRCSRCGRSRSRRHARCSTGSWGDAT